VPTTRERWKAFHRLWRIMLGRKSYWVELGASECFRVMMYDWRWIRLVEADGDELATLRQLPREVRWYMVGRPQRLRRLLAGQS
jgi:hypothetical protein